MTATVTDEHLDEAVALIDNFLPTTASRDLISSAEVADLVLDIRTLLTADQPDN